MRAKQGDADAFTELMQIHMSDMVKVSTAILMNDEDAADAIQDTILTCYEKLYSLRNPQWFRTWMTRILINRCLDYKRKKKPLVPIEEAPEAFYYDTTNLEFKEAMAQLDEKYRVPMVLYYGMQLPVKEISGILHLPRNTVLSRLARGRQQLSNYYQKNGW